MKVFEIQKAVDGDLDSDGYVIVLKSNYDRFYGPEHDFTFNETLKRETNRIEKIAFTVHRTKAFFIEEPTYIIPEVRAGPIS